MRLRTQILSFLLLFALLPLLAAVVINLPLVLDRLELFYHKAHLQNLRADFRNLDQHLASRHEMARVLAKLPEPGIMPAFSNEEALSGADLDRERARYTEWVNRLLGNLTDVTQILFLGKQGEPRFWLERDNGGLSLQPTVNAPVMPSRQLIEAALAEINETILVSRISITPGTKGPAKIALHIVGPISLQPGTKPVGAAVMTIDIGGMANTHSDTLWVLNDGRYLGKQKLKGSTDNAFDDYAKLDAIFSKGILALWEDDERQVIWMPMFPTEESGALWVGRTVDPSPLADFNLELTLRVLGIIAVLIALTLGAAHWVARHSARISRQVTDGIRRVVENNEAVSFDWHKPNELRRLGDSLTELAQRHHENVSRLRAHARALEASNRYKSEFLANVSHELRTPLNSILLLSKLLTSADPKLPEEQAQQANVIYEASRNLKTLIDNILDMSRIEAGKAAINIETISLPDFLRDIHGVLAPQFHEKGLGFELVIEPSAPQTLESDPDKIAQIIRNFLSNSVKFTATGRVTLRLHGNRPEKRFPTCVSVEDSGIGIPQTKQETIFAAFQQADGSTSRSFGGSGLGLTISRQLARLLGGDIFLNSEPGKGSMFTLGLPDVFENELREGRSVSHEPDAQTDTDGFAVPPPKADFSNYGMLIIDDSLDSLLQLAPLLEGWGMRVCAAGDSEEAAETLKEASGSECGMVLINCSIAPCELRDTIRHIHNIENMETPPPIIALVNKGGQAVEEADAVINAPLDPVELHDAIEQLINRRSR